MASNLYTEPPQRDSWFAPFSVDLFAKVFNVSIFHPFVCWLVPLCLRARVFLWESPTMIGSIVWATFVTALWIALQINDRIAHGAPREVDLSEEVIVVTGGASGLGMLVAEVYGMRGATVAVLDVNEMDNGEARGITYYKCDVSDSKQVFEVAKQIEKDVSGNHCICDSEYLKANVFVAARHPYSSDQQRCHCDWEEHAQPDY